MIDAAIAVSGEGKPALAINTQHDRLPARATLSFSGAALAGTVERWAAKRPHLILQ